MDTDELVTLDPEAIMANEIVSMVSGGGTNTRDLVRITGDGSPIEYIEIDSDSLTTGDATVTSCISHKLEVEINGVKQQVTVYEN